jgi:hypothetical protein
MPLEKSATARTVHAKRAISIQALLATVLLSTCAFAANAESNGSSIKSCPKAPNNEVPNKATTEDPCQSKLKSPSAETLLACAAKAQEQVADLQARMKGLDDDVDAAARNALKLKVDGPLNRAGKGLKTLGGESLTNAHLLTCAAGMQALVKEAAEKVNKAQEAAKAYVQFSLSLKERCGANSKGDCPDIPLFNNAVDQQNRMTENISAALERNDSLRELALHLQVRQVWEGASAVEALRFARLLRDFPEAKSLLGEDAVFLSASTKGSEASLRLSNQFAILGGIRRYGLVISTPLADGEKRTNLYSRADGLAGTAQVTFTADLYKGKTSGPQLTMLSLGITGGREKRAFIADGTAPEEKTAHVHPMGFTLVGALFDLESGNKNTHVIKLSRQRTFDDGEGVIRCPVPSVGAPFVDCLQGTLGAPKPVNASVASYQYRAQARNYAAAPSLSYNSRSKVAEVDVPVYLVRSADDKERPFNAGISLGWASKGKFAITGRPNDEWRLGVFFGAPFAVLDVSN